MKDNHKTKLQDIPRLDRPREKLIKYGPDRLSNSELLAILLRTGKRGENVVHFANKLLKKYEAANLPTLSYEEFKQYPGLGTARSCEIVACFELGKRLLKEKKTGMYLTPEDVWKELRDIRDNKKEHFVVFYLDARNQEIKREIISIGSLNANLVHPREVFEPAIKNLAAQILLAHNHPSGDPEPSDDDKVINARLVEAGKVLGIEVIDHVIVTKDHFVSFKEKGIL